MTNSLSICFLSFWMFCTVGMLAQPDTDIFLLDLNISPASIEVSNPLNITRRNGYDNQPSFTPDGNSVLYASIPSGGLSDIFRYDISKQVTVSVTNTRKSSEYSPIVTPDGKYISMVQQAADSTQRIVKYSLGKDAKKTLMPDITNIGYYTWYHKKKVAMFLLGDSFTLETSHVKKQKLNRIANHVGRSVHTHPISGGVTFVNKYQPDEWYINEWNPKTKLITRIVQTLPDMEDYCWTPDGTLLMGKGSVLYSFRPGKDAEWQKVGDLGIGDFYRIAVNPTGTKLAVVVYQDEKP